MKDLEREQTLKLFYDCDIVKKDYGKKATLAFSGNTAITTSVTEIAIPAQAKIADSFTVTGLKTADTNVQTSIKIELEKSDVLTQLALTVTPTFVLDKAKVKIAEITATGLTGLGSDGGKLEVFQDKLYLLNMTGERSSVNFYSSSDGTAWKKLATPQDATDNTKLRGYNFDTTVYDGKLWATGVTSLGGNTNRVWNFDGTKWKQLATRLGVDKYGAAVSFDNSLYQIGGQKGIYVYDGSKWISKHTFANDFGRNDAVVFDGKIWIPGGKTFQRDGNTKANLQTVATYDGTTYRENVANLPQVSWWAAVEVFPRGLLVIGGYQTKPVNAVFWSRFGKNWTKITGITDQDKLNGVISGATVVWNDALWAFNRTTKKILKITYDSK